MNLSYNNYKFNKASIAILLDFIKDNKINLEDKFISYYTNYVKQSINLELERLVKKEILNEKVSRGYSLTKKFCKYIKDIDLTDIRPYKKKINSLDIKLLEYIGISSINKEYTKENISNLLRISEMKFEFKNTQQIIKEKLYAADLIDIIYFSSGKFVSASSKKIYRADYSTKIGVGKQQINDWVKINQNGIDFLEENNIYIFRFKENKYNINYSNEIKPLLEVLMSYKIKEKDINILFNNNNEYQVNIKFNNMSDYQKFLVLNRERDDYFYKKYNIKSSY